MGQYDQHISKHQVTYLRSSGRSLSTSNGGRNVAHFLLGRVDDLASLQGDGTLLDNLLLRVARRLILDGRLAGLQGVTGATANGSSRLSSSLFGESSSGRLGLGLDSDGLRLIILISLRFFGLDSSSLLATGLLGGRGSNGSVFGVGFNVFASIGALGFSVSLDFANLGLQLVEGGVGRSTSLVAANGGKLVEIDLEG